MNKESVTYYKLILAQDLISFLINQYVRNVPIELKAKTANIILDSWDKKVSKILDDTINPLIKAKALEHETEEDVQSILVKIHRMEPEMLRKEFKSETRDNIFRSFIEENK
ncbi:MAG: hypothetical protein K9L62_10695 [Vallitaleaceae bacterium]|jgi:hypothetical protein|nr:hypothetical protein [Vallitaleaceae bacterium]